MSLLRTNSNPISERKLAANRENAQKSTGPRTEQGKRNSALNSTRHAILAKSILVDEESADRFAEHLNSYLADFCPADATERRFVETMAINHWRVLRLQSLEAASIRHEIQRQHETTVTENPPTRIMLAVRALNEADRHYDSLGRQERRYQRAHDAAMDALFRYHSQKTARRTHQLQEIKRPASAVEATTIPIEPNSAALEPKKAA